MTARVVVPHADALQALAVMVGWHGGHMPLYRYAVPEVGLPVLKRAWVDMNVPGAGGRLARLVRTADERLSEEVELALPGPRRWVEGVGGGTVLWAVVEGSDQLRRARAFKPLPSLVVQAGTGSRRWMLWWLEEFVKWGALRDANRKLAYHLRATQKWGEPDTFRLPAPGSCLRRERARPMPVTCARLTTASYTVAQVVGRLKEPPERDAWLAK